MPNENEPGSQTPEAPQYVTPDQLGQVVNQAITSHLKRINFDEMIGKSIGPLIEQIKALQPAAPNGDEEPTAKPKGKEDPRLAALSAQMEDMKKSLETERNAKLAAEKSARNDRAYTELRKSLEGKVAPGLLDMVANNLFKVEGRVIVAEDGSTTFKTMKPAFYGSSEMEEVEMPIEAGVAEYLKSESAKAFLPAPSTGGNATPLQKRPQPYSGSAFDFSKPATSDEEKLGRAMEREARALQNLK
jgi:hypothetical protein